MNIKIEKDNKIPYYVQIAVSVEKQIMAGEMAEGSVLPSERVLAKLLGVHRNTVSKAYNELKAEGIVASMQGVGFVVSRGLPVKKVEMPDGEQIRTVKKPKKVNWASQIKDEYLDMEITFDDLFQRFSDKEKISMGSGISSTGIYDKNSIARRISNIITEEGKSQYFYSPYKGDAFLRKQLVSFLSTKGISATAGQIQILTETNQAIDFIVTLLVSPGDVVVMEEPVSPDAYRAMELGGAKIVGIPVDDQGMDIRMLESVVETKKPKLIYVNSSFHDPTGCILSLDRRKKLVEISNRFRVPIVEEDAASELVYTGPKLPPVKSFDTEENVIYIYSFSLTFVPGLSLAFVVANKDLIRSLSYLVSVRMMAIDWMCQKLISGYLSDGTYYGLLDEFRRDYEKKQDFVCSMLDEMKDLGIEYTRPRGGVYIWCKLPKAIDSKEFIAKAYKEGLSLLPGYVFFPKKNGGRSHIRINYSYESLERLAQGMKIFRKTLEKELQLPKAGR